MKSFIPLVVIGIGLFPWMAAAQAPASDSKMGIAAVVNDQILSTLDLEDRVRLALGTTGLQDGPEIREKLRPQILRALIDERLQLQEAQRSGIDVGETDIAQAITTLESGRGKPPGSLRAHLQTNHLPVSSFEDQLRAQIAWNRLVMQKIRPKVRVSNEEVERTRTKQVSGVRVEEVQIAALELPVDRPDRDEGVKKLAERLAAEIRAGASFDAVSSQFSAEADNIHRNEPFWVQISQLDPLIATQLKTLKEGDLTNPVRTVNGYQVVKLLARRVSTQTDGVPDAEVAVKQIVLSLKPDAKPEEANILLTIAKEIAKNPGSCTEKGVAGLSNSEMVDMHVEMVRTRLSDMPEGAQGLLQRTEVGSTSEPFATPQGLQLYMLCERMELPAAKGNAEKVRNQLFQEKLALEASKFMRNLRREAFVDIRL